ncbi:hypothetical protein PFISCL1PPCAC_24956, partial [Pristionchus fissidentatus]
LHFSYVFSTMLLLRYFAADPFLGSVVKLLSKMGRILLSFVIVILVFWFTYAVTILSLSGDVLEYREIPWNIFRNGAFEIFGELEDHVKDGNITGCSDTSKMKPQEAIDCITRTWLIPICLVIYVLVSTVIVINLITSFLTSAYDDVKDDARFELQFEFYRRLDDYEKKPFLPPPLTLISYAWTLLQYCYKCYGRNVAPAQRQDEAGDNEADPRLPDIEGNERAVDQQPDAADEDDLPDEDREEEEEEVREEANLIPPVNQNRQVPFDLEMGNQEQPPIDALSF